MKRILVTLLLPLALLVSLGAQERVSLSAPVQTDPGATEFRVASIQFNYDGATIHVVLREFDPVSKTFVAGGKTLTPAPYTDATATAIMTALNKADLSTKSLHRRILERLQADGKLAPGTLAGNPQE